MGEERAGAYLPLYFLNPHNDLRSSWYLVFLHCFKKNSSNLKEKQRKEKEKSFN